tara:strand:+ start:14918 stop:16015 length:1098 start_codon:yes stop_codon:yes gene_type:complete
MSKEIHKDVRSMQSIIDSLGITTTDKNGMICSSDCTKLSTVLVTEDKTKYEEHTEIIEGDHELPIHTYKGKKAFIMTGSSVSADKMKIELKEHGMTITSNPQLADVFISNNHSVFHVHDQSLSLQSYMFYIQNGYSVTEFEDTRRGNYINDWMARQHVEHVLWDNNRADVLDMNIGCCEYDSLPYDTYVYTGISLEILDRIYNHGATVISERRVMEESPNQQVLTSSLLNTIKSMYDAGGDDRSMLEKLLPTIRTDVNRHLLWQLAGSISRYNFNSRSKDLDYWWSKAKLDWMGRQSAESFLLSEHEDDKLTNEGFKYLEPMVRQEISISNRELYVFKVQVKPELANKYLKIKKNESKKILENKT